jgi:threonine aldolase
LTVETVRPALQGQDDEHYAQPRVISITQATELGTVYQPGEIESLARLAHDNKMFLHIDGARIANAAACLGMSFREITRDLGVDLLSFGGTKNGMMYGEAIVLFNSALTQNFKYIRKQGMHLASKMRFIAAQFEAYLINGLWLRNAAHANTMAQKLARELTGVPGIHIMHPVETNGVFAAIPGHIIAPLQQVYPFYVWDEKHAVVRWMTTFDTTDDDVLRFVSSIKGLL